MSSIGSTPARRRDFREHSAFRGGHVCVCAYVVDDEYREEEEIG